MELNAILIDGDLRLGAVGFADADRTNIALMLEQLHSPAAPWKLVDTEPYHALLLERGTRSDDPAEFAVLRVAVQALEEGERARQPLVLRKPVRPALLKTALDVAVARLILHDGPAPQVFRAKKTA